MNMTFYDTKGSGLLNAEIDKNFRELLSKTSERVFYASRSGAISDADLSINSTTTNANSVDSTPYLQAMLNAASALGARVEIDGAYSQTGLLAPLGENLINGTAHGCGLFLRSGSNKPSLRTAKSFTAFATKSLVVTNLILHGNLAGQTRKATPEYGAVTGISAFGVQRLFFDNNTYRCIKTYATQCLKIDVGLQRNTIVEVGPAPELNQDGPHFDSGCNYVTIDGLITNQTDDSGCNADDNYNGSGYFDGQAIDGQGISFYKGASGPVLDFTLKNMKLKDANRCGVRILSAGSRIENVLLENISGTTKEIALVLDPYLGAENPGRGNVGKLVIRDWNVRVQGPTGLYTEAADAQISMNIEHLVVERTSRLFFDLPNHPSFYFFGGTIGRFDLIDYNVQDNSQFATKYIHNNGTQFGTINIITPGVTASGTNRSCPLYFQSAGSFKVLNVFTGTCSGIANVLRLEGGTAGRIKIIGLDHTETTSATVHSTIQVPDIYMSGWTGFKTVNDEAYFPSRRGDAFGTAATLPTGGNPSLFADEFDGALTSWTGKGNASQVFTSGGLLNIAPGSTGSGFNFFGISSTTAFDHTNKQFATKLVQPLDSANVNCDSYAGLSSSTDPADGTSQARWLLEQGVLYAQVGGPTIFSLPYDPNTMNLLQFRIKADPDVTGQPLTVFFHTSDGTTSTQRVKRTVAQIQAVIPGFDPLNLHLLLAAGTYNPVQSPGTAKFEYARLTAL